jgi:hypothetical protein
MHLSRSHLKSPKRIDLRSFVVAVDEKGQ